MRTSTETDEWQADVGAFRYRPGFTISQGGFTIRGLMNEWLRVAAGGQQMGEMALEGTAIENELGNVVKERTGAESITTWIIQALEHDTIEDTTGLYGHQIIQNVTISFLFCSTLQYVRKSLSADEFAGGFMHRFMIAYETENDPMVLEKIPSLSEKADLVSELQAIRKSAPESLTVDRSASSRLDSIRRQPRHYGNAKLAGFYNRLEGITLKLGMLMALGDARKTVTLADVELAYELLIEHFAPSLEGILDQLDASQEKKALLDLADSLYSTGPAGWSFEHFLHKLGTANKRRQSEVFAGLISMELGFASTDKRIFATREWRDQYEGFDERPLGWEVE